MWERKKRRRVRLSKNGKRENCNHSRRGREWLEALIGMSGVRGERTAAREKRGEEWGHFEAIKFRTVKQVVVRWEGRRKKNCRRQRTGASCGRGRKKTFDKQAGWGKGWGWGREEEVCCWRRFADSVSRFTDLVGLTLEEEKKTIVVAGRTKKKAEDSNRKREDRGR